MTTVSSSYDALTGRAGLVDLSDRTQIELTGADRALFLHNFSTNDIRKLSAGSGREAFFLDARGHTLVLALVFSGAESHVIETVPGQAERLLQHLERYHIREQVELYDRSAEWGELLLAGSLAPNLLQPLVGLAPPADCLAHVAATLAGRQVWLRRVELTLPGGYLIACRREDLAIVSSALCEAGAEPCDLMAFEAARLEAGTPLFGRDITDRNLPQEVARDERAISFTKGCYLGQETVARIDALGHVNQTLVGVRFSDVQSAGTTIPEPGCELSASGQAVGRVTSAAWSPRLQAPLALAYVRRGSNTPGTKLDSPHGPAEVVSLPLM